MSTNEVKRKPLSWEPRRMGILYCAPACGGRCTWAAHEAAVKASQECAVELGKGWKPRVWENLGWHWAVHNPAKLLTVSLSSGAGGGYWASLDNRWTGCGRTPLTAIRSAIREARPELASPQSDSRMHRGGRAMSEITQNTNCGSLRVEQDDYDKAYVIERMIAGEWTRWSGGPETRDFCDRLIMEIVRQAAPDESAANIDRWRTVRAYPRRPEATK